VANYTYTYDLADRLTAETLTGTTTSYSYDAANQLTNDTANNYSYDLNGNRTMTGYQTGTGNQLTNDATWTYTYDNEGNLTKKSKGASAETWFYGYDNQNHMTSVKQESTDGGSVLMQATYVYDAQGNRLEKDVWTSSSGLVTVTRFAYDQQNAWADLNGSNQLQMRRLYMDSVDQLVARIDSSGNAAWYLTDRLGSVRDITDATGNIQDHINYDGFGKVTAESVPGFGDRFKWTSRESDSETGLQYSRARSYDPATGRWLGQDPIGFGAGDSNLYRYVHNGPTIHTDASGLYETDVHFYMTYYIAAAMGLCQVKSPTYPGYDMAYTIAWADAYTDVNSFTEPLNVKLNMETLRQYHFRSGSVLENVIANSPIAAVLVDRGVARVDEFQTGIGLHAYQDSWSHEGFSAATGHSIQGHYPDVPWLTDESKAKAADMAANTYEKLRRYMENLGILPRADWDSIKQDVTGLLNQPGVNKLPFDDKIDLAARVKRWHDFIFEKLSVEQDFTSTGDQDKWASGFVAAARKVLSV
jgi:RHS repeat-associated protein